MRQINLSEEQINDLLTFLNRIPIQGNTIGEAKSLLSIVEKIEESNKITTKLTKDIK